MGAEASPIRVFDGHSSKDLGIPFTGVAPWKSVVLKPCCAGEGGSEYLFFPDATTCTIKALSFYTGECVNVIAGHLDAVTCCCFRPNLCEL